MGFEKVFRNTSEIEDPYELKYIICELESQNFELKQKLDEERGRYWVLEQILQHTGKLTTLEKLFESLTDILMGVFGVDACKVYIEIGDNMKCFNREIGTGSGFHCTIESEVDMVELSSSLKLEKDDFGKFSRIISANDSNSILITPLFNFRENRQTGFIVMEHKHEKHFTEKLVGFFNTVAIQISIVAENAIMYEEIMDLSKKDTLTKCYNRKHYNEMIRKLGSKAYSLAVYDLDNFKHVNDYYGHEEGDEVLVKVADMSFEVAEQYGGSVIRYGGDEFIIIVHEDIDTTMKMMENLRRKVQKHFTSQGLPITITSGIASYPLTTENEKELFFCADAALMSGKKKRKNKIYIAEDCGKEVFVNMKREK